VWSLIFGGDGVIYRGAQIQTNSNKNRKPIQKTENCKKTDFFWMCLDVLFLKSLDRIGFRIDFSKPIRTKPHAYILIPIYIFISMNIYLGW
jgi:hypothetical protein